VAPLERDLLGQLECRSTAEVRARAGEASLAPQLATGFTKQPESIVGLPRANPTGPDGPDNINGYEDKVFNTGNNQFPGDPGGALAIQARSTGNIVEVAVKRAFLDAMNGGIPVEKAAFRVDLGVTKVADLDSVSIGDPVTYTLTVSNLTSGTGNATGIMLLDTLPATLDFVSATPSIGSCSGDPVLTCTIGTLENGTSATVTVTAKVLTLGTILNRAWIDGNETDTITANDTDDDDIITFDGTAIVTVEGGDTLPRLPSNGVSYAYGFVVEHTYSADKDVEISAWTGNGTTVLTVDSITGSGVVQGPTADTATLAARPRNAGDSVFVWVSVLDVSAGSLDNVTVRAAVVEAPSDDSGDVHFQVIRPALTLSKIASPADDATPGTEITYTIAFGNSGDASASNVIVVDSLPSEVAYKLGSASDSMPAGVSATLSFSDDGGTTWVYAPADQGCTAASGYDACVTHVRWSLAVPLADSASAPLNAGTVQLVTRVR